MVASFRIRSIATSAVLFLTLGLGSGVVSCVSLIPVDEYTIARAAMDGAKESEAPRFAPALWYKAEQAYREGETFFRERAYNDALKRFSQARTLAEQAENAARLSRFESGDLAP
jgi:hypothetical protein